MKHKDILSKLTLEKKIDWTTGNNLWSFLGSEELGIDEIMLADGPHGVRVYEQSGEGFAGVHDNLAKSTLFPSATGMAATFNEELIYEVGKAIGEECNMFHVDVLLAPGVNLKRSPLGGRNFEYYSEDPYLTGRMATNFINGVQSTGVGACIKHFALNEQETNRRFVNTIADERTMHELYLAPFKMAMDEAKPFAVMSSYNKVNGHYAGESTYLLKTVLRKMWNYKGAVISDWGGVQNKVKSIKNGMNLAMPGPTEFRDDIEKAIKDGSLTEKQIDNSLLPLLTLRDRVLLNENKGKKTSLVDHHKLAQKVAEEAIVLLENEGVLPLHNITSLGVIGQFAKEPRVNGGGSATLRPHTLENPLGELSKRYTVTYAKGYTESETNNELLGEVKQVCENNETVIFFAGTTEALETEGKDRPHMSIPFGQIQAYQMIRKIAKNVIVVLNNGSALDLRELKHADAIIEAWFLGGANAVALCNVLDGTVNPSGRLSETFPYRIESTPLYGQFPSKEDDVNYHGDIINLGYRYYDTHGYKVKYPFGYGKSYSKFKYLSIALDNNSVENDDLVKVTIEVMNKSKVDGKEVVQLYVEGHGGYYPKPRKELKAFKKVFIKAGETVSIQFVLNKDAFSIYSVEHKEFILNPRFYNILVGKNVNKIKLKASYNLKSEESIRPILTLDHPLKNFFIYRPDTVNYIKEQYRDFPWYEIEEPALRVLNRVKKQFNITDKDFQAILDKMLK